MPDFDVAEAAVDAWAAGLGRTGEQILRLVLAATLGGLVGAEREITGHPAGFRTFMLVTGGSALAMIVSQSLAFGDYFSDSEYTVTVDPGRIAYGVMAGVGFLGAGTILHEKNRVRGLTTAATIWAAAALGLAAGFGLYVLSLTATAVLLLTLTVMNLLGDRLPTRHTRHVRLSLPYGPDCLDRAEALFDRPRLWTVGVRLHGRGEGGSARVAVDVRFFRRTAWEAMARDLLARDDVRVESIR